MNGEFLAVFWADLVREEEESFGCGSVTPERRWIHCIDIIVSLPLNAVEEEVYTIESSYRTFACAENALLWTTKGKE